MEIHHLTTFDNFKKIINDKIIKNRDSLNETDFRDTANQDIIEKRGKWNKYVPFHIDSLEKEHGIPYNRSVQIDKPDDYLYIVLDITEEFFSCYSCKGHVFHPNNSYSYEVDTLISFEEALNSEKRELKKATSRFEYSDHKTQEFFMSEVLIPNSVPINLFNKIIVPNNELENKVKSILSSEKLNITVKECVKNSKYFYKKKE